MTTGTQWVSAQDIADAMGISRNGIAKRARRSGWKSREVANPGGGRPKHEYCVADLPEEARAEIARREVEAIASRHATADLARQARGLMASQAAEAQAAELASLTDAERAVVADRVTLLQLLGRYVSSAGISAGRARSLFAHEYTEGGIDAALLARLGPVSARTMQRWQRLHRDGGVAALAPKYGKRGRSYSRAIEEGGEIHDYVLGTLYQRGRLVTAKTLRDGALARYAAGALDERVPSERTFERHLAWLRDERPAVWAHLVEPHKARGQVMPAVGSMSEDLTRPNERWELDSTLADVMVRDVDGQPRRYHLLCCVDVYTRRVAYLVSRASRSVAVAALLRRCVLDWGVPEAVKTDNGKDYVSTHVELVLEALDVRHLVCPPFAPWHKPHVERAIRSFQHSWLTLVPGFVGHDVADRKAVESRTQSTAAGEAPMMLGEVPLPPQELQEIADDWTRAYAHQEHSETGVTPFELARGQRVRRVQDPRALDVLLAKQVGGRRGVVTVQKKGIRHTPDVLRGTGRRYWYSAPELVAGDWVRSRRELLAFTDEADIGRLVIYTATAPRQYVCTAVCPQLAGTSLSEAAAVATAAYKDKRTEVLREGKRAARRYAADQTLAHIRDAATGASRVAGAIGPADEAVTPALDAAAEAARALDGPTPEEAQRAEAERSEAQRAEAALGEAVIRRLHAGRTDYASDDDRYLALAERLGRGEGLSDADRAWWRAYEQRAGGGPARTG